MFIRPVFQTFGITLIATGILLIVLIHTVLTLIVGLTFLVGGLAMIYRHYTEMGTDPDVLDYIPGPKGSS